MDGISLLKNDHERVNEIFRNFEKGGNSQQFQQLFQELKQELQVHSELEKRIFYPTIEKYPDLAGLVQEAYKEHAQVEQALSRISQMDNTTSEWSQEMTQLMHDVQHHVQEEETEMFPKVRQVMEDRALDELGNSMMQVKSDLKVDMAGMSDSSMSGNRATM
jgi:hemerythrin superfamily protein